MSEPGMTLADLAEAIETLRLEQQQMLSCLQILEARLRAKTVYSFERRFRVTVKELHGSE